MSEHYLLDGLPVATYPFKLEKALEGCLVGILNRKTKTVRPLFLKRAYSPLYAYLSSHPKWRQVPFGKLQDSLENLVLLQEKKSPIFHYKKVGKLWEVCFLITSVKSEGCCPRHAFSNLQAKRKKLNGANK